MSHFKFLLDEGVKHLARHFPVKRVFTLESLGLSSDASDDDIVDAASIRNCLLVVANRRDFVPKIRAYVAKSTKKDAGCRRVSGLLVFVPNEEHVQERLLRGLERRLVFEGKKITFKDVHDRDLLVQIEASGAVKIKRLPRCPHCTYHDKNKR